MFTGVLTEEQYDPANKLCGWQKLLLGYPQGSGKSVIAIAAAEKLLELNYIDNVVILAQAGNAWQWPLRIKEFTDHEDVTLVESTSKKSRDYSSHDSLYTVIPWSIFRNDHTDIINRKPSVIIADEAQEFSSFRSKTFKLMRKFKAKYKWALTGTAISNKLEELYAIMQWVDPYFLPHWPEFEKRHIIRNPVTKQITGYKNIEELHKYLLSRRMVYKDVTHLPELLPVRKYVDKDDTVKESESKLIEALINAGDGAVRGNSHHTSFDPEVSRAMHDARKAVCGDTKLQYAATLLDRILSATGENRVVVFCFYKEPIYELRDILGREEPFNYATSLFTGDQSSDEKQDSIRKFKEGEARILLCSNAGSTGLDLPFANYVIHLDVPFSHGIMDQRSTRVRRTSSSFSTVKAIFILVKDSIDEFYFDVAINKGKLAKAVRSGGIDSIVMRSSSLLRYLLKKHKDDADRDKDRTV